MWLIYSALDWWLRSYIKGVSQMNPRNTKNNAADTYATYADTIGYTTK
jgi:hypothetical protein